ncbi:MAG TPA: type II secretion system secretin GspD [Kofleriaceae bacterium]|jgi:general secretion pathway protein D
MRFIAAVLAIAALCSPVLAKDTEEPRVTEALGDEAPAPGEDAKLYSCKKPATATIEVTFKPETQLQDLVTWVMGFTCKNFIYAPAIVSTNRKITIIAPSKMTVAEAYRLFLASLSTLGMTVVPQGNIMKIVETATSKHMPVGVMKEGSPDNIDQLVRYVLRPQYVQADAIVKAISSVKSDPGEIVTAGSLVLITDYAANVRDMLSLAKLVDVPGGSDGVYTIPVLHADATKLMPEIQTILGTAPGAPSTAPKDGYVPAETPSKLVVDDRTNTIVMSGSAASFARVSALVERLDVALDTEDGSTVHVYQLGSAIAEEVAATLTATLPSKSGGVQTPRPPGQQALPQGTATPTTPIGGVGIIGDAKIIADKPTNKLIVVSSGRDYLAIKEVIKELDQPRRQVYIEALILELAIGDDTQLGVSFHGGLDTKSGGVALGGLQTSQLSSANPKTISAVQGLVGGLIGSTIPGSETLLGTSIPSYGVLVQALQNKSNTNIVSAPSIIALDNEQATYKVGTNIPYIKGYIPTTTLTTATSITTNVDRVDLQLELTIKPHITLGDQVLLEIKHDAKDYGESSSLGPSWTTREFETRTVVPDQQTVVIGGLLQEKIVDTKTQIPLLGDIPLLGYLFRYNERKKTKSNLVIMLTPYIIKDHLDLERIRERRQREHDEFSSSMKSLDGMAYDTHIDYTRKRGLVEEINRSLQLVEADAATLNAIAPYKAVKAGAVQVQP